MVTLAGKKWRNTGGSTRSVVLRELCKQKKIRPVGLLVVDISTDVLFEGLVGTFCLIVTFGMITRGKVENHSQRNSEAPEKAGNELWATVGGDMGQNTMFGEVVHNGKLGRSDSTVAGDENALLG